MYSPWEWLMFFYLYCFVGWIWESCYVSARKRRWVNRGFMKGPLLPIYGSGALCILGVAAIAGESFWITVLAGTAAATLLEYVTGAVMEALFKVRYWDYSTEFMNLNGYICLKSTLCWGVMTALLVYVIHPPIAEAAGRLSQGFIYSADMVITALGAADFATSFKAAMDFRNVLIRAEKLREELRNLQSRLDELERQLAENVENMAEKTAKKREELRLAAERARESVDLAGKREELRLAAERAKESVDLAGKREELEALRRELQLRQRMQRERFASAYSRSIHGLLKRNPGAVSRKHGEALEEIRRVIREHVKKGGKKFF